MHVPIFMPSALEHYLFHQGHMDYNGRFRTNGSLWPLTDISPFNETNVDTVTRLMNFTDYWRFPSVLYFETIPDLLQRLMCHVSRLKYSNIKTIS